eukprot:scaffold420_cov169-Ochromonas_danica.AAC.30
MARDEARVLKRREENEIRRQRYLQAKVRLIGVDVQALNQQVAEKHRLRQDEKEADRFERLQAMEIERLLAQSAEEERQMREFQMQQLKESWESAKSHQQTLKAQPSTKDFDIENCGPASALRFAGEDQSHDDRLSSQKAQMKKWIQEQIAEKAALRHLEKEDEMSYAEMLRAVDEIREQTEREEAALRKYITDSVKHFNQDLAQQQRDRNRLNNNQRTDNFGQPLMTSLPAFDEDKLLALDATGHIIRRDMFKGFTDEQKRKILMDNQEILRQKSLQREEEKKREYDWMIHQILSLRAMEQAEEEERQIKAGLKEDHLSYLRDQIDQQRRDREEWNKTKYGDIRGGFFDGFGKSCR